MGEIAESMIDGVICQECGAFIGEACGYPRCCSECESDGCDVVPTRRRKVPQDKQEFQRCAKRAAKLGLALRMHTEWHLTLRPAKQRNGNWLVHIYPGKRRVMWDRDRPATKFVAPPNWTLDSLVTEGARLIQEAAQRRSTP